jgi:hypothetical protein
MPRRGASNSCAPGSRLRIAVAALVCCGALLCAAAVPKLNVDENGEPCTNTINGVLTADTATTESLARRSLRAQVVTTVVGCNNVVAGHGVTVHGNGNLVAGNIMVSSSESTTTTATTEATDSGSISHPHEIHTTNVNKFDIPATVTGDYNTIESNSVNIDAPAPAPAALRLVVNGSHVVAMATLPRATSSSRRAQ